MNCSITQGRIPDLWMKDRDFHRKVVIENHLVGCNECQKWYVIWQNVISLAREQILLPKVLNWTPFNRALEVELQRHKFLNRAEKS